MFPRDQRNVFGLVEIDLTPIDKLLPCEITEIPREPWLVKNLSFIAPVTTITNWIVAIDLQTFLVFIQHPA